jgi:hypothetical protein
MRTQPISKTQAMFLNKHSMLRESAAASIEGQIAPGIAVVAAIELDQESATVTEALQCGQVVVHEDGVLPDVGLVGFGLVWW